jgi:hypothetical protein
MITVPHAGILEEKRINAKDARAQRRKRIGNMGMMGIMCLAEPSEGWQ